MNQIPAHEIAEKPGSGEVLQLVGFTIDDTVFGVDILLVHEIIRAASLTSVPNAPDYVEGLAKLRGNIFPLVDLRKKLRLFNRESDTNDRVIIVLEIQGMLTGIIVDTVTRVLKVQPDSIKTETEQAFPAIDSYYITGTCSIGETLIVLPDFNRIFSGNDK